MNIKHREKSPIICPTLSLCIGVLTWIHIWSHVTSHVIIAKHKHTNKKGELRKKNNTNNKIINIKPHPIYLIQFLVYWLLYNITPQSHNLYEKDPFTTLVLRDYHASTSLPARGPTLRTSPSIVQLYELAHS